MVKTRSEIQSESDAKRGVVAKTYKLPKELVDQIASLAAQLEMTQAQLIQEAVNSLQAKHQD